MDFQKAQHFISEHKLIRQEFIKLKNKSEGFEKIYSECYKGDRPGMIRLLTSQSYGPLMEKLHIRHYNKFLSKVPATKDLGDYKNTSGRHWEYKFSITNEKGNINFVQLRPWQQVDYVFEVLQLDDTLELYLVPKKEMQSLLDQHGHGAHGTKEANLGNKNVEYALRPVCTSTNRCWQALKDFKISRADLERAYEKRGV